MNMGKVPKLSGNKKLQLSVNFLRDQKRLAQLLRQFFLANIEKQGVCFTNNQSKHPLQLVILCLPCLELADICLHFSLSQAGSRSILARVSKSKIITIISSALLAAQHLLFHKDSRKNRKVNRRRIFCREALRHRSLFLSLFDPSFRAIAVATPPRSNAT